MIPQNRRGSARRQWRFSTLYRVVTNDPVAKAIDGGDGEAVSVPSIGS